jgi:hypothetical protein
MKALPFMFEKKISKKSYTTLKPLCSAVRPSVTTRYISRSQPSRKKNLVLLDAQSSAGVPFDTFELKKLFFL